MSLQAELDASKINSARHQPPPWKEVVSFRGALSIRKKLISLAPISMVSGLTFATAQDQTPGEMSGRQRAQYGNSKRSIGCRRPKLGLHRVASVEDLFGGRLKSPANGSEGDRLW
jgi:hypothetical protein